MMYMEELESARLAYLKGKDEGYQTGVTYTCDVIQSWLDSAREEHSESDPFDSKLLLLIDYLSARIDAYLEEQRGEE